MTFDWSELAFGSKKPLRDLKATFIAAPRELSEARLTQLIKQYLPAGNIVLGIAKEGYVDGFDGQPHFKTLTLQRVQPLIKKVNAATLPYKVYTLSYFQRELPFILEKVSFKHVVLVNGSWQYAFHTSPTFYQLVSQATPYELVSPFTDETEAQAEAKRYEAAIRKQLEPAPSRTLADQELMDIASKAAKQSFDYNFQTGAVLAKPAGKGYRAALTAWNKVVPYQTYAMHHGAAREKHFSPPQDLNHYDTVHAETMLVLLAQQQAISLKGMALFINLLPCPTCARLLAASDIGEVVYSADHSNGYAVQLLEAAGKTVRRVV